MLIQIRVFCTTQFEEYHQWREAPEEVYFLRTLHRHNFHVRAEKVVTHDDRDVEFILLKKRVNATIEKIQDDEYVNTWSCERWASELLTRLNLDKVEVSEDGENGAVVERVAT